MPFKSQQQAKLMFAVSKDPEVAKKTGISKKVADEYIEASKGMKFSKLKERLSKKKD